MKYFETAIILTTMMIVSFSMESCKKILIRQLLMAFLLKILTRQVQEVFLQKILGQLFKTIFSHLLVQQVVVMHLLAMLTTFNITYF